MTDLLTAAIKEAILPDIIEAVRKELREHAQQVQNEKFISVEESLNLFEPRLSRATLYNWMAKNLITSYQIGGRRLFKYSEFIESIKKIKRYQRLPQDVG